MYVFQGENVKGRGVALKCGYLVNKWTNISSPQSGIGVYAWAKTKLYEWQCSVHSVGSALGSGVGVYFYWWVIWLSSWSAILVSTCDIRSVVGVYTPVGVVTEWLWNVHSKLECTLHQGKGIVKSDARGQGRVKTNFERYLAFSDCNASLHSPRAMAWSTELELNIEEVLYLFLQCHP